MGERLPAPLYQLPRAERNAAAREIARYCLLPDPRPRDDTVLARVGRWFSRAAGTSDAERAANETRSCIAREINGKLALAQDKPAPLSRIEYDEILTDACRREAIGRLKGQVRDFHDPRDMPEHPLHPPRHAAPPLCKAQVKR